MKKRILGLILVFAMLLACVPGMAAPAAGADLSANVKVSDFRFLTDGAAAAALAPGKTVTAECKLERTAVGTEAQSYCFVLQVIDNGKLLDLQKAAGSVSAADGKKTISVTSQALGQDTSKYEVVALLVSDMATMTPLAMPANFGNSTCGIASITVAGKKVPLEAGKTDYSMDLSMMESDLPPAIEAVPYDLSTSVTVNNISGTSGTATVTAVSHDGNATAQYNLALNITALTPASLKSVTVDGTPLEGFHPDTLEYRIHPSSNTEVPVIAFEKALASTEATVIAAEELPGTTVVKTKAADGSERTYKFQFTKTVEVSPAAAALSFIAGGKYSMKVNSDNMGEYDFSVTNPGRINRSGRIFVGNTEFKDKAHIAFQPELPPDSVIESAELDLGVFAVGSIKHVDVHETLDTTWVNKTGNYEANAPAYAPEVLNNEVELDANCTKRTYRIDPSFQGRETVSFTVFTKEKTDSWYDYAVVELRDIIPKLRVTYYKDYVEPEKLAFVTFDGKSFGSFDPDTLEYKIPSADGQTASPVIAAIAGASSTKVTIKQASGFPGKATVTTEVADGKTLTYTFLFMKTVEVTPVAAAASFTTGGRKHLGVAHGTDVGTYLYDKKLADGSAGRINQPGRIFLANGSFDDKAHLLFRPEIPLDAVVDSAELDLSVSAIGSIRHIDVYENTDTSWKGNATGTTEEAGPGFDSSKVLNSDIEIKADKNYYRYTYQLDPSLGFEGRQEMSLTAFTRERGSWSAYAVLELREGLQPTLRINYYKEDSIAEEGQVTAVTVGGKRLEEFDPAQYDYVIKTDAGATEAPKIEYTLADNTTATYIPATELPGTATIVTSGNLTYRFKLAKTEQITASMVGNKRYNVKENFIAMAAGTCNDQKFYNYGTNGRMLLVNWNGSYTSSTSYAYLYFNTAVPADCTILDTSVSLTAGGFIKGGTGENSVHMDLFENTDTAWTTNSAAYGAADVVPAISANRINTESPDIAGTDPETFNRYTYQITPESICGKTGYGICALGREKHDTFKIYSELSVRTGEEPVLTISYYKD